MKSVKCHIHKISQNIKIKSVAGLRTSKLPPQKKSNLVYIQTSLIILQLVVTIQLRAP